MHAIMKKTALAIGVAGVIAIGTANPSWAAPVSSGAAGLNEAMPSDVIDVRHRRHWRRAATAGLALAIIGGIAAEAHYGHGHRRHYRHHDYPHGYYYGGPWGSPGPYCWRHRGHRHCD